MQINETRISHAWAYKNVVDLSRHDAEAISEKEKDALLSHLHTIERYTDILSHPDTIPGIQNMYPIAWTSKPNLCPTSEQWKREFT